MLALISPAKKLAETVQVPEGAPELSRPQLVEQASLLAAELGQVSAEGLAKLMRLSPKLAQLNAERHKALAPRGSQGVAAGLLFQGDVYQGLALHELGAEALGRAQAQLRILSGLYGLLRPFDGIQPYRLEMGTRLATSRGSDLYAFWGERIRDVLMQEAEAASASALVNLASQEYGKAARLKGLDIPVVSCVFKERRGNKLQIISFSAKRARGLMARYMLSEGVDQPEGLKDFALEDYRFETQLSSDAEYVFVRPGPSPKA